MVEIDPRFDGCVERTGGRKLRVGALEIECTIACPRCVMITHGFARSAEGSGDHARGRARRERRSIGIYARLLGQADVAIGDPVELVE